MTGRERPVIGISAYGEHARWGVWDQPATLIPQNYVDKVVAAGAVPLLLPPVAAVAGAVGRLDGLIFSGGPDVEPARYEQEPGRRTSVVRPERDAAEIALLRAALEAGLPILGICRGMQLVNVALGGTLIQHLPDVVGHEEHSPTPGAMGEHKVTVDPSSRLAEALASGAPDGGAAAELTIAVPTHHHQGIDRLAAGLTASAWADDGTIEAIEFDQKRSAWHPFTLAVQWHPEASQDHGSLFRALVAAAAEMAAGAARLPS